MPVNTLLPSLMALISGFSCLGLELVWFRYLHLILGNSTHATAAVTAFFMLGMAVGNAFWGRLADRTGNPASILRLIFIGITLFAAGSPVIYRFLSFLNAHPAFSTMNSPGIGVTMPVSALVLIIPAMLTGGIVPVLITLRNESTTVASKVGRLYGLYTLGGALGAFAAAFLLMPKFGLRGSLYCIGLLQPVLLLVVKKPTMVCHPDPSSPVVPLVQPDCRISKTTILVLFAVSGFTALSYEVFWTRILILFFRNSIYDFSLVLSATLTGIVIGSFWCGAVVHRIRRPIAWFAAVQILIAGTAALSLTLVHTFPSSISFLQSMPELYKTFGSMYWLMGNTLRFLAAFLIVAPQAVLFGASFPLISKAILVHPPSTGRDFGMASALNGIGSAAGSFAAGFLLIPLFGISDGIRLVALINIGVGLLTFIPGRRKLKSAVFAASAGMVIITVAAVPHWNKLSMSQSLLDSRQKLTDLLDLLYYNEDASGMVSVVKFKPSGIKYLYTDRLFGQNSSAMNGSEDHRRLGQIPVLLHGGARNTLVIGLGAGITLRGVVEAGVENIICVEVSKNICTAAGCFDDVNRDVLHNPAVRIINRDGRAYLASVPALYDVIIGDIFFPMSSGSGMIYSRDFFELCKKRLLPDGLFCQWLPIHQFSQEELQITIATFSAVFPDAQLWYGMVGPDTPVIGCIGCKKGLLTIDFENLSRHFDDPSRKAMFDAIALPDPMALLSNYIASGSVVGRFCTGAQYTTDDRPVVEFLNPRDRNTFNERGRLNMEALRQIQENIFESGIVR